VVDRVAFITVSVVRVAFLTVGVLRVGVIVVRMMVIGILMGIMRVSVACAVTRPAVTSLARIVGA